MGKTASKVTRALGFGGNNETNKQSDTQEPVSPNAPQWDTTIDQLFGDAPPGEEVIGEPSILDAPIKPRKRRRAPPPPPSMSNRGRRRPPTLRNRRQHGGPHAMATPVVPEIPRRVATGSVHATNGPFGVKRRPIVVPVPAAQCEVPARIVNAKNFKRRSSSHRRRIPIPRNQRLQELLQCPVCLTPYTEPRLLPCGHTYCNECLNRLIENDNDVVTCPECRKQHLVPEDGVFPTNFVVRSLLEEQGMSTGSRIMTPATAPLSIPTAAKCTACETFASLRLCRHCNFMVCDRCLREHRHGSHHHEEASKRASIRNGKLIQFYVAVRKVNRNNSQVKRLTIEMPIGNYIQDSCETLIRRIANREQLDAVVNELVLEFGDKRLRPQRTLSSYGVQNGDLLFLFNPDQRLSFLAYGDEENSSAQTSLPSREKHRIRTDSLNSTTSDIRTTTSNDMNYQRSSRPLSTISDDDNDGSSLYSDN